MYGLKKPKKDFRDLSRTKKFGGVSIALPDAGLERTLPASRNQFATELCTGFTADGIRAFKYGLRFSPEWFCSQEALLEGGTWNGAGLRTQAKVLTGKGILPQDKAPITWQQNGEQYAVNPQNWDSALGTEAMKYKADIFLQCDGGGDTYDNIRTALFAHKEENEGVSAGMDWHFTEWNGVGKDGVLPFPKSQTITAHDIDILDWNEQGLIFDPHLGSGWGNNGYGYMSRDIANKCIYTSEGPYIFLDGIEATKVKQEQWNWLTWAYHWCVQALAYLNHQAPLPPPIVPIDQSLPPQAQPIINTPEEANLNSMEKDETPTKYLWDNSINVRYSVRVICDEEGLSVNDKNVLCACVEQESNFNNEAIHHNKDLNGNILSTDYYLCQINDHYHIGEGKDFPSVQFVHDNPDKIVRWMCGKWKAGQQNLWASFSSGAYKKYL